MTATFDIAPLADVLAYDHPGVVRRYCKENHATPAEGAEVFRETLKFLYLAARSGHDGVACPMTAEVAKLDEMWHTFLLFTRDYAEFCDRHFGTFIDHIPVEGEGDDVPAADDAALRASIERQFGLVYDVLGEGTLVAWYDECRYAA